MPTTDTAYAATDYQPTSARADSAAQPAQGGAGVTGSDPHPVEVSPAVGGPDHPRSCHEELRRLRRVVGEQFATAVVHGHLDVDLANGMLEMFGLPALPRRWQVRLHLPIRVEVTAGTDSDAVDAAEDAIEQALQPGAALARIDLTAATHISAVPVGIDVDALTDVVTRHG